MKYQFQVDFRPAAPVRKTWEQAAQDAVNAGYATWQSSDSVRLASNEGASIERLEDD